MKLQTKLLLVLLAGLLSVYAASCLYQRHSNLSSIHRFATNNLAGEVTDQWEWIGRLHQAVLASLEDAMAAGDMEKFNKILHAQRTVADLQEVALADRDGKILYSSDPTHLKQFFPADLRTQLSTSLQEIKLRTNDAFALLRPVVATKSCLECHVNWKQGEFCGITCLRFSDAPLKHAEQSWTTFNDQFDRQNFTATAITGLVLTATIILLLLLTLRLLMAKPLIRLTELLSEQAHQVTEASLTVETGSQSIANDASHQAASLEETSASMEELLSMTRRNAEHADRANALSRETSTAADQGVASMNQMNAAMQQLQASSQSVEKIIKTIDEIAFQTNLLALNASVEAARAGEAGLGFAVVADEVRALSHRSATAAKETAEKIADTLRHTNQCATLCKQTTSVLDAIVVHSRGLAQVADGVAAASKEQTVGIDQINQAVSELDRATQHNAAASEEGAAAAEQLKAQAAALNRAVAELQTLIQGTARQPRLPTRQIATPCPVSLARVTAPPMPTTLPGDRPRSSGVNAAPAKFTTESRASIPMTASF